MLTNKIDPYAPFAPALLLDILARQKRYEEAEQLVKSVKIPEKTHPDALNNWLAAQFNMYLLQQKFKEAKVILNALATMPNKHPRFDDFKEWLKDLSLTHKILTKIGKQGANSPKKGRRFFSKRR